MIKKNIKISVIGLGYVGLPLLLSLSKKFNVVGLDIDKNRINHLLNNIDQNNEFSKIPFDQYINYSSVNDKNVLEIGCGYGFHAEMILKNSNPKSYTAIDITSEAIEATKKRLEIKKLNMENLQLLKNIY